MPNERAFAVYAASNMKERDIRPCDGCGKGLMHHGPPIFTRVRVSTMGVDLRAVSRQAGLGQFLGSAVLAAIMGPDEVMARMVDDEVEVLLCLVCANTMPVAEASHLREAAGRLGAAKAKDDQDGGAEESV